MPKRSLAQCSFFDPEFVSPECLTPGTVPWLLARRRSALFPRWLLRGWRGEGRRGRKAWPAPVLLTLLLLRWTEEGTSRLAAVRRARHDSVWRAALGLAFGTPVPDERTVRDFEAFLKRRHAELDVPRYLLLHEHMVRLCREAGVVGSNAVWGADSTPMWCYGAVLDTVRLLGDGVRSLGRRWAGATGQSLASVATDWDLPLLLAKSTKGALDINWRDRQSRDEAVSKLAEGVLRAVSAVRRGVGAAPKSTRGRLLRRCRDLAGVIRDDFEGDEEGRLVIARRVSAGRLISLTDPQARHGHKSRSRTFNGYKVHLVGDLVSGLVASLTVSGGNEHDGRPAHRLIRRAKTLFAGLEQLLADTAYGGTELREEVRLTLGVTLVAPVQPTQAAPSGRFVKRDFAVDFERNAATCPAGVTTTDSTRTPSTGGLRFVWPAKACEGCPLRERCCGASGRRLLLHPKEQALREAQAAWLRPEVRTTYRARTRFERLVNELTRHGARRARAFGLRAAQLQVHLIAATNNLRLLARHYAAIVEAAPIHQIPP